MLGRPHKVLVHVSFFEVVVVHEDVRLVLVHDNKPAFFYKLPEVFLLIEEFEPASTPPARLVHLCRTDTVCTKVTLTLNHATVRVLTTQHWNVWMLLRCER
jgi:hypothetical protein